MDSKSKAFAAVQKGDLETIESLLAIEPDIVNARNEEGSSLLLLAIYTGRRPVFELLLKRGAGVNLHEASAMGLDDRVVTRLDADPTLVNSLSHDGWTPLHLASFFGHREVAALLIERGADVNARSTNTRFGKANTPLHAAAANGQITTARTLIERGADVNARDGSGFTPLALAAGTKSDLLVIALLDKGARAD